MANEGEHRPLLEGIKLAVMSKELRTTTTIPSYVLDWLEKGVSSPADALTLAPNPWQPQRDYAGPCLWATARCGEVGKFLEADENRLIRWKSKNRYMLTSILNS